MRSRRTCIRLLLLSAPALVAAVSTHDARAQSSGTTNSPLPNVMLLIDTSGSMERMPDSSLPVDNHDPSAGPGVTLATGPFNQCSPGVESNPNRWGMLVQALTGNMQPFFSCAEMPRTTGSNFANEFKIGGVEPYDVGYVLPYHRPLSGSGIQACAFAPRELPGAGAGAGVGVTGGGAGGNASDFPATAFRDVLYSQLPNGPAAGSCTFEQAIDGQLDATRDYVRFSLMTFDTDQGNGLGVSNVLPPGTVSASPFAGLWTYAAGAPIPGQGRPQACATSSPFDVGARHWAAPPWEGRHVPFPDPQGTLYDVARTNDQIQKVIMSSRPFGATPIDGLVEDARDYLWRNAYGPNGTQAGYADDYYKNGCRRNYIVLLTDGAPNLNLRPQCGTGAGTAGGQCPYPWEAWETVQQLYAGSGGASSGPNVTTYVIGFSVNGSSTAIANDGFPSGYTTQAQKNCKAWYAAPTPTGGGATPTGMETACQALNPPKGSTADACCQLNKIAFYGTGANASSVGAFFAETQADLVLSFGRILANVSKDATSRTPPAYSPIVTVANQGVSAKYVTSFIPNALKPWSGEIDRTRAVCPAGTDQSQTPLATTGDSYAQNTAAQAVAGNRFFVSVRGAAASGSVIDSARTMRPYTSATAYTDNIPAYIGTEVADLDDNIASSVANWAEAMDIDANTCKRSRVPNRINPQITDPIPRLTQNDCRDVIWNFTTASAAPMTKSGIGPGGAPVSYDFNIRCRGAGGLATGTCSLSGAACTVGVAGACPVGQVCVSDCAALGAIYHSTPAVVGAPAAFLREDSFTQFAQNRRTRRPAMYVATTDGVLHAFKALETSGGASGGNTVGSNWELWNFVPPAVLPKLASNYPSGQQILLDGSPVVKDVVWDRAVLGDADQWHTTLVAGLGAGGGGYYALNVSDSNCGSALNSECNAGTWQQATTLPDASIGGLDVRKRGPHFLWQLTDFLKDTVENGIVTRTAKHPAPNEMVTLFGKQSGTPAITTLRFDPADGLGNRQIGVAILPGGIDGPPEKNTTCPRGINSGYSASTFDRSDTARAPRGVVRRWSPGCGKVAGRSVTIVRLDTGEVIRHFGRASETPGFVSSKLYIDTPFDSPMVGTPAVFPNAIGQFAQRAIIGDADGTLWNIDLTNSNPALWAATLFQDLYYDPAVATDQRQPVSIPLAVTQDSTGAVVVNAATGDQENIVASSVVNYVFSIRETPSLALATPPRAEVKWRRVLTNGERVTGPMVVFDRTLFFATHLPDPLSAVCGSAARSRLWGMDFLGASSVALTNGGASRWCPRASVNPLSGICNITVDPNDPLAAREDIPEAANAIIPGVTLRPTLSCTAFDTSDPSGGINGVTPQRFELFFSFSAPRTTGATPSAGRLGVAVPVPRIAAIVDAWSLVFD